MNTHFYSFVTVYLNKEFRVMEVSNPSVKNNLADGLTCWISAQMAMGWNAGKLLCILWTMCMN
jgi:hypothetical protein